MQLVLQHLDTPEDTYPSFSTIANAHFLAPILGDINVLSNAPMTCGNKPEAHPDNHPVVASYKINLIPGGIIFNVHSHHWSNGLVGANGFWEQLAENCFSIVNSTSPPSFDPRCLDRSLFNVPGFPNSKTSPSIAPKTDAPPRAHKNIQHKPSQFIMFHLPKSKAALLKAAAMPSSGARISTYNALCALLWRVLTRLRIPLYKPDPAYKPFWAEGVSLNKLFTDPPIPARMQGNLQFDITSAMSGVPALTVAEISSSASLAKLAMYTRAMTDSVTLDMLHAKLAPFANVRNKHDLSIHVDAFPPLSLLVSDWRMADLCTYDFGFGKMECHRHLFGGVPLSQVVVYPARVGPAGEDEGLEVMFAIENELVQGLMGDREWGRYFEYRGVDAWDEEEKGVDMKAKL